MYGTGFFLMPYSMLQLSGDPGVPTNLGWVRWAGGFVLGIAIGPWLASEGWVKEQPFIAGLAAAFTLSGLALLYSAVSRRICRRGLVHMDANCPSWPCSRPANVVALWRQVAHGHTLQVDAGENAQAFPPRFFARSRQKTAVRTYHREQLTLLLSAMKPTWASGSETAA